MSPIRHVDHLHAPLYLMVGSYETPEFQRQTQDFAKAVAARSKSVELIDATNHNHFEIMETLANPYGIYGSAVLRQIQASVAHAHPCAPRHKAVPGQKNSRLAPAI